MIVHKLPDALVNTGDTSALRTDDIAIVRYHQSTETSKVQVQATDNLIVILLNGKKEIIGIEGKLNLQEGEGFFLKKGHYLMNERFLYKQYYESLLFFFSDEVAHQLSHDLRLYATDNSEDKSLVHFTAAPSIKNFSDSILLLFKDNPSEAFLKVFLPVKIKELFILLAQNEKANAFSQYLNNLNLLPSIALNDLMELHYKENLSIEQYAFLAKCSLSSFKRLFKATFNTTPAQWIQNRRLKEAALLLSTTAMNVSEIGFEVGFENTSHFVQAFKKCYDTTPMHFRQDLALAV